METITARRRSGLILGKFLPPHRGHMHLIEEAQRRAERLTILVCSLPREPIPGDLRAAWMREMFPQHRIVHVRDELPSYPHEHPEFWDLWTSTIRREAPDIDVIFTSETYGDELARRLGIEHQCIDPDRRAVPVSGTDIRRDPMKTWDFIPECVRPHFVKRVAILGSECTGKTTIAQSLAEQYATAWSPEFGREFVERKEASVDFEDFEAIGRGQIEVEERAARRANRVLILDTNLIETVVYSRHYFGSCPQWIDEASRSRRADLYLLADIDVPWIADANQRDRGDRREEMHSLFREALRERGIVPVVLRGNHQQRMAIATRAIDRLISYNDR